MDERKIIERLQSEGFQKVYAYEAEPGEVDEQHQHEFDTKLVVLKGKIYIALDQEEEKLYTQGDEIFIPREMPHSAKVGTSGCRYVVAEKHA